MKDDLRVTFKIRYKLLKIVMKLLQWKYQFVDKVCQSRCLPHEFIILAIRDELSLGVPVVQLRNHNHDRLEQLIIRIV